MGTIPMGQVGHPSLGRREAMGCEEGSAEKLRTLNIELSSDNVQLITLNAFVVKNKR